MRSTDHLWKDSLRWSESIAERGRQITCKIVHSGLEKALPPAGVHAGRRLLSVYSSMNRFRIITYREWKQSGIRNRRIPRFLIMATLLWLNMSSCEPERQHDSWVGDDVMTICEYLNASQPEYSKFYRILEQGKMLGTLCGYNPYGEGYTLFLPDDEAVERFLEMNQEYRNFEELLQDTLFLQALTRYHTVNKKLHTNEFPYGALTDRTLTGERLTIGFYTEGDNPLYKVNNMAPVTRSNLEMSNGYIHVVSEVLQRPAVNGYETLRQDGGYSILGEAMKLSGIDHAWWPDRVTILAEHDSIYHRYGIQDPETLVHLLATPGLPLTDPENEFYQYVAYHLLSGEYYLNDFYMGSADYRTMGDERVTIEVGLDIRINPGLDTFRIAVTETGDTLVIDYIGVVMEASNIMTGTGPIHSVSELLVAEPIPELE